MGYTDVRLTGCSCSRSPDSSISDYVAEGCLWRELPIPETVLPGGLSSAVTTKRLSWASEKPCICRGREGWGRFLCIRGTDVTPTPSARDHDPDPLVLDPGPYKAARNAPMTMGSTRQPATHQCRCGVMVEEVEEGRHGLVGDPPSAHAHEAAPDHAQSPTVAFQGEPSV